MQRELRAAVILMARWGLSGKCIQRKLTEHFAADYSVGHIYSTVRGYGLRLKNFRDGETEESMRILNRVDTMPTPEAGFHRGRDQRDIDDARRQAQNTPRSSRRRTTRARRA